MEPRGYSGSVVDAGPPIHIHIPIRYNVLHWVIEEASPREGKQLVRGHTARPRTEELPI